MQMHVAGAGPVGLMLTALLQPMERLPVVMAATKYGSGCVRSHAAWAETDELRVVERSFPEQRLPAIREAA